MACTYVHRHVHRYIIYTKQALWYTNSRIFSLWNSLPTRHESVTACVRVVSVICEGIYCNNSTVQVRLCDLTKMIGFIWLLVLLSVASCRRETGLETTTKFVFTAKDEEKQSFYRNFFFAYQILLFLLTLCRVLTSLVKSFKYACLPVCLSVCLSAVFLKELFPCRSCSYPSSRYVTCESRDLGSSA